MASRSTVPPERTACGNAARILWHSVRNEEDLRPFVDVEPPPAGWFAFRLRFAEEGPFRGLSVCVPPDKNYPGSSPKVDREPDTIELALLGESGPRGDITRNEAWGYSEPVELFTETRNDTYRDIFPKLVEEIRRVEKLVRS